MWPADIDLVHRLWQELSNRPDVGCRLHHRDIVSVALRRLDQQLHSPQRSDVLADVQYELYRSSDAESVMDGND
jgi:hypothetical protein